MFTGIVEGMGKLIDKSRSQNGGTVLKISCTDCPKILEGCALGDSIAVNGTCLTVTDFRSDEHWFTIGVAPESLRRTNLGAVEVGEPVNLEPAMSAQKRFGGHFVQGHVDATCRILAMTPENESLWLKLSIPKDYGQYIVSKGYVALDGTSLTVCDVVDDAPEPYFTIMLVEYTQQHVILPKKKVGDLVNLEVDMIGKYVERCLSAHANKHLPSLKLSSQQLLPQMQ